MTLIAHTGAAIHDGETLHPDAALLVENGYCAGIVATKDVPATANQRHHAGGVICPAFVDLQVNGGGGIMFNAQTDAAALNVIAAAHARLGTEAFLPTLITDTPERTRMAVAAVSASVAAGNDAILGLHLEGPHLSVARKGAHDPGLIRAMSDDDLAFLCSTARTRPKLLVTLAPESATPAQIETLTRSGVIVSLGHSDADFETCRTAFRAGAGMVTHLFNAMSQLTARSPGLVGAALDTPGIGSGLIADGHHVHPANLRAAVARQPDTLFLVSDAMATAGSDITEFTLNDRRITRRDGRLTLADGTLAGADLDMHRAIHVMTADVGLAPERAIAMATGRPARAVGLGPGVGRLRLGDPLRALRLSPDGVAPEWI